MSKLFNDARVADDFSGDPRLQDFAPADDDHAGTAAGQGSVEDFTRVDRQIAIGQDERHSDQTQSPGPCERSWRTNAIRRAGANRHETPRIPRTAENGHRLAPISFEHIQYETLIAIEDPSAVVVDLHHDRFARNEVQIPALVLAHSTALMQGDVDAICTRG